MTPSNLSVPGYQAIAPMFKGINSYLVAPIFLQRTISSIIIPSLLLGFTSLTTQVTLEIIKMKQVFALAIIAAALVAASPANDWSRPCFDGECAYDIPSQSGSGALKIFGSSKSVTDITPAAGWVVLDCDRNALAQDIRLVCNGDDAGCNHMFDHDGPVHKIVRLPAECGSAPFARIAAATVAENQSVPSHVVRRDGSAPQVHTIRIDDNFAAIDSAKVGTVEFALLAANFPGVEHPDSYLEARDFDDQDEEDQEDDFDADKKGNKADGKKAGNKDDKKAGKKDDKKDDKKDGKKDGKKADKKDDKKDDKKGKKADGKKADGKKDKADDKKAGKKDGKPAAKGSKKEWFNKAIQSIKKSKTELKADNKDKTAFSIEHKKAYQPVTASKNEVLYSLTKVCPANAKSIFKIAAEAKATIELTLGVAASGTGIDIDGKVIVNSDIVGDYKGVEKAIVAKQGAPSLDIPGVFKLSPSVTIYASIDADINLQIDYEAEVNYALDDIEFWYPPSVAKSFEKSGKAKALDTYYSISATPDVEADVDIDFHLRPLIEVDVVGFKQKATVFIEADSSVNLDLDGSDIDKKGGKKDDKKDDKKGDKKDDKKAGKKDDKKADKKGDKKDAKKAGKKDDKKGDKKGDKKADKKAGKKGKKDAELVERAFPPYGNAARELASREPAALDFDGCTIITTHIDVNGGSSGKFFDIFKGNNKVDILDKKGFLVKKCYGDVVDKNGDGVADSDAKKGKGKSPAKKGKLDPLVCPAKEVGEPLLVAKETVKAKKILN
ncbi:hypothetical protein PC9H_010486 [Pleurotus ostreatus]|uniref:Uncharacterized protein n=1 Tax=Pleurotus ostreatus TaxID=5322 RepID=A0A8H6ZJY4_PLEOS|nr:uncharacterized protein PC9H_010486 [Pleurotus ostreatus]KAF7422330.1 hypothetical protein PC9H_010486 [Pleurotus ostreatus]